MPLGRFLVTMERRALLSGRLTCDIVRWLEPSWVAIPANNKPHTIHLNTQELNDVV